MEAHGLCNKQTALLQPALLEAKSLVVGNDNPDVEALHLLAVLTNQS